VCGVCEERERGPEVGMEEEGMSRIAAVGAISLSCLVEELDVVAPGDVDVGHLGDPTALRGTVLFAGALGLQRQIRDEGAE
jgi:hypothetical protein